MYTLDLAAKLMWAMSATACLAPKHFSCANVPIGIDPLGMCRTLARAFASALHRAELGALSDPRYMHVACTAVEYHRREVDQ